MMAPRRPSPAEAKAHLAQLERALHAVRKGVLPPADAIAWPSGLDRALLSELPLSTRTWNCLSRAKLTNGQSELAVLALMWTSNFGRTSLADLLLTVVDELASGRSAAQPQDHDRATFAPRLSRDDGAIDWQRSAADLHNQVRGLHPWPHAFSYLGGARYAILQSAVAHCPEAGRCTQPGEIVEATKDRLIVAAGGETALAIQERQPEGKRPLPTRAFLAGHRLKPGARFGQSLT